MNTVSNSMKITKGQYDRPAIRHWAIEADGRKFTAMAERGWRNNGQLKFVTWTIFVWEKTEGREQSLVTPFEATSAPRAAVQKIIAAALKSAG